MSFEQFEQPPKEAAKKEEELVRVAFETKEGEKFFAETLTSPEDPRVEKVQQMLARRFSEKEVDPVEVMQEAMTGKMETGEECPRYLVSIIENEKREVVAMASGAAVELVDRKHRISEKEAVLLDAYTVVSPELQKKGVDKHLFKMREMAALKDAESRGLKLVGYVVEDGGKDEEMYNRHGAKRVYEAGGKVDRQRIREIPYLQAPVDWNKETGKPARGAGVVPEHLMIKLASGYSIISPEKLMDMARGMFLYNNERERGYFKSKEAYQTHLKFLREIEKEFIAGIAGVDSESSPQKISSATKEISFLNLFSKEKRNSLVAEGAVFQEHKSEEDLANEWQAKKMSYHSAGGPRSRIEQDKQAARRFSKENKER